MILIAEFFAGVPIREEALTKQSFEYTVRVRAARQGTCRGRRYARQEGGA
jgi:hypothetical protein